MATVRAVIGPSLAAVSLAIQAEPTPTFALMRCAPAERPAGEGVTLESMRAKGPRPRFSRRGEHAIQAFQEADNLDAMTRLSHGDEVVFGMEAKRARERGEVLLEPVAPVMVSGGEAVTWENQADEIHKRAHAWIIETLEHPNAVSAGASGRRMSAAMGAEVLEPAIDAAMWMMDVYQAA
jgi:hypothetical protein